MLKFKGIQVKEPTSLAIERYNLTKNGRVASGKMTMELVAKKRTLQIGYDVISGWELKEILDLIDGNEMFFTVEYDDFDGIKSGIFYAGAIPSEYFRRNLGWYWKNVTFQVIEQ